MWGRLVVTSAAGAMALAAMRRMRRTRRPGEQRVVRGVTVQAPAARVEELAGDAGSWPVLVENVEEAERDGDRWRLALRGGSTGYADVTRADGVISFHVTGPSSLSYLDGLSITRSEAPGGRGQEVRAGLPGRRARNAFGMLTGTDERALVATFLRRLKQVAEVGFVTTVAGQPSGRAGVSARVQQVVSRRLEAGVRP